MKRNQISFVIISLACDHEKKERHQSCNFAWWCIIITNFNHVYMLYPSSFPFQSPFWGMYSSCIFFFFSRTCCSNLARLSQIPKEWAGQCFFQKFEILYTIDVSNKDTVYETKKQANISIKQQTHSTCMFYLCTIKLQTCLLHFGHRVGTGSLGSASVELDLRSTLVLVADDGILLGEPASNHSLNCSNSNFVLSSSSP